LPKLTLGSFCSFDEDGARWRGLGRFGRFWRAWGAGVGRQAAKQPREEDGVLRARIDGLHHRDGGARRDRKRRNAWVKGVVLLGFLGEKFLTFRSDPVAPRADRMRNA
jgi:hypothetical protein